MKQEFKLLYGTIPLFLGTTSTIGSILNGQVSYLSMLVALGGMTILIIANRK